MGSVPFAGAGLNALHLILASLMINLATTTYSYISLCKWGNSETSKIRLQVAQLGKAEASI